MNDMFGEREVLEEAADRWWIFLVTGIAWLIFALLVFQWDYTTVSAISYLFGVVAIVAGVNEFLEISISTTGLEMGARDPRRPLHRSSGSTRSVHPYDTFETLAALDGRLPALQGDLRHHGRVHHEGASSSSGGCSS